MSTLLLNASYEPLRVVGTHRAIVLVLEEKAEIIAADDDDPVRSAYLSIPRPKVIRLLAFVKIPWKARAALNRRSLMARDRSICQYCKGHGNTIDHVVPRARGGKHEWSNVVAACSPCNQKKGDRLLSELGWTLSKTPEVPRVDSHIIVGLAVMDPEWEPHLRLVG